MSDSRAWTDQWFKAQQQFVDAWSEMARSSTADDHSSQADLWAQSFDLWRQASGAQAQPEVQQAMNKCFDMGREYLVMAEQISKGIGDGTEPMQAVHQWMEQLKQSLQQMSAMPGFNGEGIPEFMRQWFSPGQSWQEMMANLVPLNPSGWQAAGLNNPMFNAGDAAESLGKLLSSPGIGYFREPQEKQQRGIRLTLEYQQASQARCE